MTISKLFVIVGALLVSSLPAVAQFGQVDGYVLFEKKGVLGAIVAFDRLDSKVHFETKTNKQGFYSFASLPTGDYAVTVTVNGELRERRDFFHISPGRQDLTQGNSALGFTFNLKPAEVARADMAKEQAKLEASDDKAGKARSAAEEARKQLMDAYNAGKEALAAKKYDEAVASLTKASQLDPNQSAVWSTLAGAYMGLASGQKTADSAPTYQKAYDAFAKAIELAPNDAGTYNNFALALAQNGKLDEARQNLAKAIELDPPGAGKYHYNLGAFLMNVAQSDAAIEEFRKAIDADPNYAESYFYLGSMLAGKSTTDASGKMVPPDGTIAALQKYLQLKPDGPNAAAAKDLIGALGSKVDVNIKDPNAKGSSKKAN